ncbi:hypothetical protein M404DRAFT_792524 [Pisolithus tinctorius Marx 270]|uniref:Uncharacterized protein n=1 Tax=Pisolithus tinctorius Marx 270 TaxID=870435 RepID=A0A0C3PRE1_PISTI|nr:hypothetical protein M404DRAFT_792524 [Pisolithus tinctorius Marx 270]
MVVPWNFLPWIRSLYGACDQAHGTYAAPAGPVFKGKAHGDQRMFAGSGNRRGSYLFRKRYNPTRGARWRSRRSGRIHLTPSAIGDIQSVLVHRNMWCATHSFGDEGSRSTRCGASSTSRYRGPMSVRELAECSGKTDIKYDDNGGHDVIWKFSAF